VWEAVYFRHEFDTLAALADAAARIGVERYVLDDGWFTARRSDRAGLGDWQVDEAVVTTGSPAPRCPAGHWPPSAWPSRRSGPSRPSSFSSRRSDLCCADPGPGRRVPPARIHDRRRHLGLG
jgi:Melibiase